MSKTNKPIFSPEIAGQLIERGFELVDRQRNYKDPSQWVYYFAQTPALLKAFDEIASAHQAARK